MTHLTPFPADVQAVILDMDGLILDTESGYCSAWQATAQQLGYSLEDSHCQSLNGQSGERIEQYMRAYFGADFPFDQFMQQASMTWQSDVEQHGIKTLPGFFDLMMILEERQIAYCLATNSRRNNAQQCLQLANIADYFSLIVTRDEVNNGKPAPDVFLLAAQLLGVEPKRCLGVEDSEIGLQAAKSAGTIPVLITDNQTIIDHSQYNAMLKLTSLSQLALWIAG